VDSVYFKIHIRESDYTECEELPHPRFVTDHMASMYIYTFQTGA